MRGAPPPPCGEVDPAKRRKPRRRIGWGTALCFSRAKNRPPSASLRSATSPQGGGAFAGALFALFLSFPAHAGDPGWPYYGGDAGGQRFSPARQITPANVRDLQVAWTYSTGDLQTKGEAMKRASFENTPILAERRLYVCSPFNEVSALDPGSGK